MDPIFQTTDRSTSSPAGRCHRPPALAALSALMLLAVACTGQPDAEYPSAANGQPVRIAPVDHEHAPSRVRLPGVVRSIERAELAFMHSGHLAERLVRRGEPVAAGQALAILHNPALMPGVAAADARRRELDEQIEHYERETRRLENLHQRGLIATAELDRTRAQRNAARQAREQVQASLDEAREQLAEATLRAPFSGQVVSLPVEVGQFVRPGQTIVSISAPDRLEVALHLSTRQATGVQIGDEALLISLAGGPRLAGTIREIGLTAPGQLAETIINLPASAWPEWRPGQAVHVELAHSGEARLRLPVDALLDKGSGQPYVFRLRGDQAERVEVHPGELTGRWLRVDAELQADDQVIVAGHGQLLDGDRVRVLP